MSRILALLIFPALLGWDSPAGAQLTEQAPPPYVDATDALGTDLITGQSSQIDSRVAIGPADAAALEITQSWGSGLKGTALYGWWTSYICRDGGSPCEGSYGFDEINLGGRSQKNRFTGQPMPDGSLIGTDTATGRKFLYDKEGTKWTFSPTNRPCCYNDGYPSQYLSEVTRSDGETLTYNYDVVPADANYNHLRSIVSSVGYELHVEWTGEFNRMSKVTLVNRRYAYCAPLATSCAASPIAWPNITWAKNASGATTSTTSGARTVTCQPKIKGPVVQSYSGAKPIHEWYWTVVSGAGIITTYTNRDVNFDGTYGAIICRNAMRVWNVQTPAGLWKYTYSVSPTCSSPLPQSIEALVRRDPALRDYNRTGATTATATNWTLEDELGRSTTYSTNGRYGAPVGDMRVLSRTDAEGKKATFDYGPNDGRLNLLSATVTGRCPFQAVPGATSPKFHRVPRKRLPSRRDPRRHRGSAAGSARPVISCASTAIFVRPSIVRRPSARTIRGRCMATSPIRIMSTRRIMTIRSTRWRKASKLATGIMSGFPAATGRNSGGEGGIQEISPACRSYQGGNASPRPPSEAARRGQMRPLYQQV